MALRTVQKFHVAAVRIRRVNVDFVIADGIVPAAEYDSPSLEMGQYLRVKVVTLVEGYLADIGAIGIHDMQYQRVNVLVFIERGIARFTFVN